MLSGGSGGCPVVHVGHCTKVRTAITHSTHLSLNPIHSTLHPKS